MTKEDSNSIFIDHVEFLKVAKYVNKHYLSKPYTGCQGNDAFRDYNQRAVVLLKNGKLINISGDDARLFLDPKTGSIDVDSIRLEYGSPVVKIMERPNHGLYHSMRAAAAVPMIVQYVKSCDNPNNLGTLSIEQQARLQRMMLFSVVGREDETGFSDSTKDDDWRYQEFRKNSALAYLEYYKDKKPYVNNLEKLYQDALVIELMGYPA